MELMVTSMLSLSLCSSHGEQYDLGITVMLNFSGGISFRGSEYPEAVTVYQLHYYFVLKDIFDMFTD